MIMIAISCEIWPPSCSHVFNNSFADVEDLIPLQSLIEKERAVWIIRIPTGKLPRFQTNIRDGFAVSSPSVQTVHNRIGNGNQRGRAFLRVFAAGLSIKGAGKNI